MKGIAPGFERIMGRGMAAWRVTAAAWAHGSTTSSLDNVKKDRSTFSNGASSHHEAPEKQTQLNKRASLDFWSLPSPCRPPQRTTGGDREPSNQNLIRVQGRNFTMDGGLLRISPVVVLQGIRPIEEPSVDVCMGGNTLCCAAGVHMDYTVAVAVSEGCIMRAVSAVQLCAFPDAWPVSHRRAAASCIRTLPTNVSVEERTGTLNIGY